MERWLWGELPISAQRTGADREENYPGPTKIEIRGRRFGWLKRGAVNVAQRVHGRGVRPVNVDVADRARARGAGRPTRGGRRGGKDDWSGHQPTNECACVRWLPPGFRRAHPLIGRSISHPEHGRQEYGVPPHGARRPDQEREGFFRGWRLLAAVGTCRLKRGRREPRSWRRPCARERRACRGSPRHGWRRCAGSSRAPLRSPCPHCRRSGGARRPARGA